MGIAEVSHMKNISLNKEMSLEEYQNKVKEQLLRHRSILDIITKNQEAAARVNRAVAKAVTSCGCIEIHALKQEIPEDVSLEELADYMSSHLYGSLCPHCASIIKDELGNQLFYIAGLANVLDINLNDVMEQEINRMSTLGKYNLR
jgi:hypothetical protein